MTFSLKTIAAVSLGKLTANLVQSFKVGSGTSLPGKVALQLDSDLLGRLGRQIRQKKVAITGTNGKSTTAGLLSAWIEAAGYPVVHNQLGANMVPGITAALLQKSTLMGKLSADYAVIEADEASLPHVAGALKQDVTLVTNLFRDQLDRYGELDTTAKLIKKGINISGGIAILNADDPLVSAMSRHFPRNRVVYYGVNNVEYPPFPSLDFPVGFPKEVTDCPLCQAPLSYSRFLYGHLGHYRCESCDFARPKPGLEAERIEVGTHESTIHLNLNGESYARLTLKLPGLFNAYNLLGATCAGAWLGLPTAALENAVSQYQSIFGRAERQVIDSKNVMILLIKNPIGAMEVLKVVAADPKKRLLIAINDNYADGRDISWLWDAPFELLAGEGANIIVSGCRAEDMAVRLKYAGVDESRIETVPNVMTAFRQGLHDTQTDQTLYVLPTYTALLQLSQALGSR